MVLNARLPHSAGEDTRIGGRFDLEPILEGALGAPFLGFGGSTNGPALVVGEGYAGGDSGRGGAGEECGAGEGRDGCRGESESHLDFELRGGGSGDVRGGETVRER